MGWEDIKLSDTSCVQRLKSAVLCIRENRRRRLRLLLANNITQIVRQAVKNAPTWHDRMTVWKTVSEGRKTVGWSMGRSKQKRQQAPRFMNSNVTCWKWETSGSDRPSMPLDDNGGHLTITYVSTVSAIDVVTQSACLDRGNVSDKISSITMSKCVEKCRSLYF